MKLDPVILRDDFNIGEEDVLEREMIYGAIDGLYAKLKVAACPL